MVNFGQNHGISKKISKKFWLTLIEFKANYSLSFTKLTKYPGQKKLNLLAVGMIGLSTRK